MSICSNNCCWEPSSALIDGGRFHGVDWPEKSIESVQKCAELCERNFRCDGFNYYGSSDEAFGDCYLMKDVKNVTKNIGDGREQYGGLCRIGISI